MKQSIISKALALAFTKHNYNITVVKTDIEGNDEVVHSSNIITNTGDQYYAQSSANETPTNDFDSLYLSGVAWSPVPSKTTTASNLASVIAGSEKAVDATYPKTDDDDSDNTGAGAGVVTWRFSYSAADFNATGIISGSVTIAGQTWGSGGGALLSAFTLTSFDKSSTDTLKIFVNHTMTGV